MPTPTALPSRRLARASIVCAVASSLVLTMACTPPTPPPMVPEAPSEPAPIVSAAPPPTKAGPRCPPGGIPAEIGPGGRGTRSPSAMTPLPLRRPVTLRPPLPPLQPFTFRAVPAAEAPSASAKLDPSDWQQLAQWMLHAVRTSGQGRGDLGDPFARRDPRAPRTVDLSAVSYLPSLPPKSPLRSASTRVTLVKALGPAVRAVASSAWFANLYARNRGLEIGGNEAAAPAKSTAAKVRANAVSKQCAYLDQLRAALAHPAIGDADRAAIDAGIAATEAQLDRWLDDPALAEEWAASEHAADVARAIDQRQRAEDRKTQLAGTYPESPQAALLVRLDALVAATADVDFAAKTVQRGHHKVFVDPVYEAKPTEWKAAYRLGKPTVEALRAFAAEWRQELVAAAGTPMVEP